MSDLPIAEVLNATANQILAVVAPTLARLVHARVTFDEQADTARTDGVRIWVPPTFAGVDVVNDPPVAVGLLVHELGHFLQPLKALDEVQARTGCPDWLANIVADIQLEAMMAGLFPPLADTLTATRAAVKKAHAAEYAKAIRGAATFRDAACALALLGRFGVPEQAFDGRNYYSPPQTGPVWGIIRLAPFGARGEEFVRWLSSALGMPPDELGDFIAEIIKEFPELKGAPAPFEAPGGKLMPGIDDALGEALADEARKNVAGHGLFTQSEMRTLPVARRPASAEALRVARGLRVHFQVRRGATEIVAPQRLDRRGAALDELVPFRMMLPGRTAPAPKLVIVLDKSGSMKGAKFALASEAAQAVALAVRAEQGEVVGVVFDSYGYLPDAPTVGDQLLFQDPDYLGGYGGTNFCFLSQLWRRWPEHQVLLVTDGDGQIPTALPGDKARTSALLIPPDCDPGSMSQIAARVVILSDLGSLADIMALLTPRH